MWNAVMTLGLVLLTLSVPGLFLWKGDLIAAKITETKINNTPS